jgi:CheY-like chemotaxis protein
MKLRILVADDEAMVRRSLRRMLELKNSSVVEVADGVAALDALAHSPKAFDLVLLDVVMPRKNGYEVLAEIRERYPELKVVLMSGYNNPEAIPGAKTTDHQPDAAMQKPFDWDEFERVLQSLLETNSALRA